jgi:hypothetical protein
LAAGGFVGGGGGAAADYPGRATFFVIISCIMAASGGLIFGYDIGISGNPKDSRFRSFHPQWHLSKPPS